METRVRELIEQSIVLEQKCNGLLAAIGHFRDSLHALLPPTVAKTPQTEKRRPDSKGELPGRRRGVGVPRDLTA